MRARHLAAIAATLATLLASRAARAWQEVHQTGDDLHVRVDAGGIAYFEHTIHWHVVRGPLKSFDLAGVEAAAMLEPNVAVLAEDGREIGAHAQRRDDKTVRIVIDEPRSIMRGDFTFDVRYSADLAASRALTRDGPTWRLALSLPVATDGFDAGKTVIDFPAAPDAPAPIVADTGAFDESAVARLRRDRARDTLELVRPHVARGEAVTWTVRVDPRAFPLVADPRLRPRVEPAAPPEPDRVRETSLAAAIGGLAIAFALLVFHKGRAFAAACAGKGATARALVALPDGVRAIAAGAALAAAAALEVAGESTWGVACAAAASIVAALRGPSARIAARGPGRWLALRPQEAFDRGSAPSHWLDPGCAAGRATAILAGALVVAAALAARRIDANAPWLVALDATALAPIFLTGRASQLPPHGARDAAPWLERAFRKLRAIDALRTTPYARIVEGGGPDELRLLVLPRAALPGLVGVELALAWSSTPVGWAATPEVLVRVLDATPAAAKLTALVRGMRAVPGRRPDERVVRLVPRSGTAAGCAAFVNFLACSLRGQAAASRLQAAA